MARDRPSPYGEVPFFTVARGSVPRERWIARRLARVCLLHRDQEVSPTGGHRLHRDLHRETLAAMQNLSQIFSSFSKQS